MTYYHWLHLNFSYSGRKEAAGYLSFHLSLALFALDLLAPSTIDSTSKPNLAPRCPVHQGVVHKSLQQCQQSLSATPHNVQNLLSEEF